MIDELQVRNVGPASAVGLAGEAALPAGASDGKAGER